SWTISTACGSSSDTVQIGFASQGTSCGNPITDARDGNTYNTVLIGTQCWMAENLAYLPSVSPSGTGSASSPYYYVYGYQGTDVSAAKATSNYNTYGVLYNWPAAMNGATSSDSVPSGVQGICPTGWYLPSDEEWKMLDGEVDSQYGYPDPEWDGLLWRGSDAGGNLKETGTTHWNSPNTGATNTSGFTALPGGYREYTGALYNLDIVSIYWSATDDNSGNAYDHSFYSNNAGSRRALAHKGHGYSVRCLRDSIPPCSPQPTQANAGPDSLNIVGDSIVLMANTPVDGQGLWTIHSGTGGVIADTANPSSTFSGLAATTYQLIWTISTACGSSSDTVIISFVSQGTACGNQITDTRDGNTYNTVLIGTQCWMAENLAYLPSVSPSSVGSNTNPYYYVYDYEGTDVSAAKATINYNTYGVLYNWPAAMNGATSSNSVPSGVQGVCPTGWYLPGDEEWKILEGKVDSQYGYPDPEWDGTGDRGTDAGGNLKEAGTTHWNSPNWGATNSSGFTALPSGYRNSFSSGSFTLINEQVTFWSSTEHSNNFAHNRNLDFYDSDVIRFGYLKDEGNSVRCVASCSPQPTQADAGPDSLNISGDSIVLMANTPVVGQGLWTIVSGAGGSFVDPTNPTTLFYGLPGKTYSLLWQISNNCGTSSDDVQISFTTPPPL
ncbi:MAG: hypothetical protein GY746_11665, partial [Gammaproteobacteria bacterium]|nr:hypothetical protein [Gammaproteobacteria bacterium]